MQTQNVIMFLPDVCREGLSPSSKFTEKRPAQVISYKASTELKGAKLADVV